MVGILSLERRPHMHGGREGLGTDLIGRIRYANNSNYRNDSLIRKESKHQLDVIW